MLGLLLAAIWRRRAQTVLLCLLAAVATGGAAAAPWYVLGTVQSLAASAVTSAHASETVVAVSAEQEIEGDPAADLAAFADRIGGELNLAGFVRIVGAGENAAIESGSGRLDYRDDVCAHLNVDGVCPSQAGEVLMDQAVAARLGLDVGDVIQVRAGTMAKAEGVTVVGLYGALDPTDRYWGRSSGSSASAGTGERLADNTIFTTLATFTELGVPRIILTVDLLATPQSFRESDPQQLALAYERGAGRLAANGVQVRSGLRALADRVFYDQQLVYIGVSVGLAELLIICWFALFFAISQTAEVRRADVGLMKMRGVGRADIWWLVAGQSLLPLLAGGAVGFVLGPRLARWLGGAITGGAATELARYAAVSATVMAVIGAIAAALIAEQKMLGESVASLNRGVAPIRRGWRAGIVDALIVLLAAATFYQVRAGSAISAATAADTARARGVEALAPVFLALAVGVLGARLVPIAAARAGGQALRAGRLGFGLAALNLARRPGSTRVIGLVIVVVGVLVGTAVSWSVSDAARHERAVAEVGADRVLTVHASGVAELMNAVRAADPTGRYAMAAITSRRSDPSLGPPVLAVDTTRLEAVIPWQATYGAPRWPEVARMLRPAAPAPVVVKKSRLTLDASWLEAPSRTPVSAPTPAARVSVVATLVTTDPRPITARFGPLGSGRHTFVAHVPACDAAPGCRLVSLALAATAGAQPPVGSAVTVHRLDGLREPVLADRTRWRAGVRQDAQVPGIAAGRDGLTISIEPTTVGSSTRVDAPAYVLDAPSPLPVLKAGPHVLGTVADQRAVILDPSSVPVRVVAASRALPRIGNGIVVDLDYADRIAAVHTGGTMQVWLAPGTPDVVVAGISEAGLIVVADESVTERLRALDAQGPPVALRFLLLVGMVCLALAVVSFAVMAAVEQAFRGDEFAALRRQGLPRSVVRRASLGCYLVLVAMAVLIGIGTSLVLATVVPASLPVFGDGWSELDVPSAPGYVLPLVAASIIAIFGATATLTGLRLVTAVRRRVRGSATYEGIGR